MSSHLTQMGDKELTVRQTFYDTSLDLTPFVTPTPTNADEP
jgi:hypothetical protein